MRNLLICLAIASTMACNKSGSEGCGSAGQCEPGSICYQDQCRQLCYDRSGCGASELCSDGVCVPASESGAPVVTSVDGTGSADGRSQHTAHRLHDRVVISGIGLTGATVGLLSAANPDVPRPLTSCDAGSDTRLEVALPTDIHSGDYVLRVSNQAGNCDQALRLLQGEAGSGTTAELIAGINAAGLADPSQRVRGALTGDVSTLLATAANSVSTARTILVNGVEQVDNNSAGLYLVVFDVASHTVRDAEAVPGYRTKGIYIPDSPTWRDALRQVLGTLSVDDVVILASVGDIRAMAQDAALAATLRDFGASTLFATLAADQAYVLIGTKALGDAQGLEQIAGPERNGMATASTVVVNTSVMGFVRDHTAPKGMLALFNGPCPPGWTEFTAAGGRALVGVLPAGTVGGTVGTALVNLGTRTITDVPAHTHSIDPPATTTSSASLHTHSGAGFQTTPYGGGGIQAASHTHTVDIAPFTSGPTGSASVDVTMPYVQLRVCSKD